MSKGRENPILRDLMRSSGEPSQRSQQQQRDATYGAESMFDEPTTAELESGNAGAAAYRRHPLTPNAAEGSEGRRSVRFVEQQSSQPQGDAYTSLLLPPNAAEGRGVKLLEEDRTRSNRTPQRTREIGSGIFGEPVTGNKSNQSQKPKTSARLLTQQSTLQFNSGKPGKEREIDPELELLKKQTTSARPQQSTLQFNSGKQVQKPIQQQAEREKGDDELELSGASARRIQPSTLQFNSGKQEQQQQQQQQQSEEEQSEKQNQQQQQSVPKKEKGFFSKIFGSSKKEDPEAVVEVPAAVQAAVQVEASEPTTNLRYLQLLQENDALKKTNEQLQKELQIQKEQQGQKVQEQVSEWVRTNQSKMDDMQKINEKQQALIQRMDGIIYAKDVRIKALETVPFSSTHEGLDRPNLLSNLESVTLPQQRSGQAAAVVQRTASASAHQDAASDPQLAASAASNPQRAAASNLQRAASALDAPAFTLDLENFQPPLQLTASAPASQRNASQRNASQLDAPQRTASAPANQDASILQRADASRADDNQMLLGGNGRAGIRKTTKMQTRQRRGKNAKMTTNMQTRQRRGKNAKMTSRRRRH